MSEQVRTRPNGIPSESLPQIVNGGVEGLELQFTRTPANELIVVARVVQLLSTRGVHAVHIRRAHRTGYKAGALAEGLRRASGELIAIFDADFVPEPDFLRQVVPHLQADAGCAFVQSRWGHRNRDVSLLTRLLAIGIDGHFVVEQAARAGAGLFFNFNHFFKLYFYLFFSYSSC